MSRGVVRKMLRSLGPSSSMRLKAPRLLVVPEDVLRRAPRANVQDGDGAIVLQSSREDVDVDRKVLIHDTAHLVGVSGVALDDQVSHLSDVLAYSFVYHS